VIKMIVQHPWICFEPETPESHKLASLSWVTKAGFLRRGNNRKFEPCSRRSIQK
jgi:hypothetical protein